MYGYLKNEDFKSVREKVYEYFSITLDYNTKGEVKLIRKSVLRNVIDAFLIKIEKLQAVASPATKNIFKVKKGIPLNKNKAELFHTEVAIGFSYEKYPDLTFSPQLWFYALE